MCMYCSVFRVHILTKGHTLYWGEHIQKSIVGYRLDVREVISFTLFQAEAQLAFTCAALCKASMAWTLARVLDNGWKQSCHALFLHETYWSGWNLVMCTCTWTCCCGCLFLFLFCFILLCFSANLWWRELRGPAISTSQTINTCLRSDDYEPISFCKCKQVQLELSSTTLYKFIQLDIFPRSFLYEQFVIQCSIILKVFRGSTVFGYHER